MSSKEFVRLVQNYYAEHGRHDLPWRKTHDGYKTLVSELMLQQTQVDRVIPFYKNFLKQFPTAKKLAAAPLAEVLKHWSGLGYNRRAKFLHEATKVIAQKGMPKTALKLEALPGVGPYTARAVASFAYDQPEIVIETNIRAALIHHFFANKEKVSDAELVPIIAELVEQVDSPREWYSAFMDYGAHIKREHPNPSRRSKHHVKQSKFEGSLRQVRGAILKALTKASYSAAALVKATTFEKERVAEALAGLKREGLISCDKGKWNLGR